ncbi:MAG: metallophosphoesterase [Mucilaginibacter sp.]
MNRKLYLLMRTIIVTYILIASIIINAQNGYAQQQSTIINIVFTSDAHYGFTRKNFRGNTEVSGHKVNAAMISQINTLPGLTLPADGGVNQAKPVKYIDYLIQTGDITNRMEIPIQTAAASWKEFNEDYLHALTVKNSNGKPAKVFMVPGNHDISNAIGYYKPMAPQTDASSIANIYNLMMHPAKPLTAQNYNYHTNKVNYSRNIGNIHFMFITLWPDSAERIWMEKDLATVPRTMPVMIFTHDQPTCEAVHFTNPTAPYKIIPGNPFENLTEEHYKEGNAVDKKNSSTDIEQRGWVKFLKAHPNIKAYFHGNSNWNEYYVYHGPDNDVSLPVFRVDSPMKGKYSAKDESLLSFQLISIDPNKQKLTVRECLWNKAKSASPQPVIFASQTSISLKTN